MVEAQGRASREVLNMAEFASKGVAGSGLGLGIAGTALGLLNNRGGLLDGLLAGGTTCSENTPVSRYELGQESKIAELESQIALRDANIYNDQKMLDLYKYFNTEIRDIREAQNEKWTEQAVVNCRTATMANQIADINATLNSITRTAVPSSAICNFGCGCGNF